MGLDLAIIGPDGSPERAVEIRTDEHQRILAAATAVNARLVLRSRNYYADTEYAAFEIAGLRDEAVIILETLKGDIASADIVERILALLDHAQREERGLSAIAD